MKRLALVVLGALAPVFSAHADFLLWLDSPARSNANDPKSPFYHGQQAPAQVPFFPTNTPVQSPTHSMTFTFSPTPSETGTPSPALTATPTFSTVPSFTHTPTLSPSLAPASNGAWPTLSTFNRDISGNNAGGVNGVGNDNDDACGSSGSSASMAQSSAGPVDSTPFLRLSYNVATNAGCGYQYASVAFPFSAHDLTGKTSIDFAIRSTATVRIMMRTPGVDPCLGIKNKMWIDIPPTGGAWQALNRPFSSFNLVNAGCPYPLNDVAFVSFSVENPGSGDLDLDNISFP